MYLAWYLDDMEFNVPPMPIFPLKSVQWIFPLIILAQLSFLDKSVLAT